MKNRIRRLNWLKVWSVITGVALTIALILTLVPFGVVINTDGLLSISLSQVGANPDWLTGWDYRILHDLTGATGAGTDYQVKLLVASDAAHAGYDFTEEDRVTPDYPNDFDVYSTGSRTIVACSHDNLIRLYNTSDKSSISEIDNIVATDVHDAKLISGTSDYAYYCTFGGDVFGILDLTDEENLAVEDSIACTDAFYCCPVLIGSRRIIFVVTYESDQLKIFEDSSGTLSLLDTFSGSDTNYDVETAWRVKYHAGYDIAVVGAYTDGTGAVSTFDASDPDNVTALHKYTGADYKWANLFIEGNKVYGCCSATDKIVVFSLASDGQLTKLGEYQSTTYIDNCHGIFVEDSKIYCSVWGGSYDLVVLDATDPESIALVATHSDGTLTNGHACYKYGDYVWYASAGDVVAIFDYSKPDNYVHLNGYCTNFPADMRLTDNDGETKLDYFIEDDTADPITVWVEVKDDLSSGTVPIYIYCGKSGESSESSGANTFIQYHGSATASFHDADMTDVDSSLRWRGKIKAASGDEGGLGFWGFGNAYDRSDDYCGVGTHRDAGSNLRYAQAYNDGVATTESETPKFNDGAWHIGDLLLLTGATLQGFIDSDQVGGDISTNLPGETMGLIMYEIEDGCEQEWSFIAEYVSPEPTHGAWGEWETPSAEITNTQSSWAIGIVGVDSVVYFSADGNQDDDYSIITNTGGCAVDIQIQGTDIEGGSYDWVLASSAGSETYSLYANSEATPTVYDIEVKSSSYNNLCTDLAEDDTYDWSMKFTAPTAFNGNDDGEQKSCTVTLVASAS